MDWFNRIIKEKKVTPYQAAQELGVYNQRLYKLTKSAQMVSVPLLVAIWKYTGWDGDKFMRFLDGSVRRMGKGQKKK